MPGPTIPIILFVGPQSRTVYENNAGAYRTENVIISGAKHRPPQHLLVKEQMENLIEQYSVKWLGLHPIERAALLHGEFVNSSFC
ncbi:Fic family protein [Desulfosporosinus shakirovi]|uniref:Fic family protein n=1 Tax=Desulfosporosinus shakirovi TaxID=2885154 RepID=UPI0037BF06E8